MVLTQSEVYSTQYRGFRMLKEASTMKNGTVGGVVSLCEGLHSHRLHNLSGTQYAETVLQFTGSTQQFMVPLAEKKCFNWYLKENGQGQFFLFLFNLEI
jgi:hypothetical protein